MILLDTNVLVCAFDPGSPFYKWARETIADSVTGDGAAINAKIMGWDLATADRGRFQTYFPSVTLKMPE